MPYPGKLSTTPDSKRVYPPLMRSTTYVSMALKKITLAQGLPDIAPATS